MQHQKMAGGLKRLFFPQLILSTDTSWMSADHKERIHLCGFVCVHKTHNQIRQTCELSKRLLLVFHPNIIHL